MATIKHDSGICSGKEACGKCICGCPFGATTVIGKHATFIESLCDGECAKIYGHAPFRPCEMTCKNHFKGMGKDQTALTKF